MAEVKNKMWDGRFSKPTEKLMEAFNNSLPVDRVFIEEDIAGSKAWSKALCKAGVLTSEEQVELERGLDEVLRKYKSGEDIFNSSDEDIHMAVERVLGDVVGEVASKLHTGRSRNDQVATDFRFYVKNRLRAVGVLVENVQKALVGRAESDIDVIIPGYTHYQQAQPVSLAHYWLSFFYILEREKKRLLNAIDGADLMPLGSGAIAGSGFQLDRDLLADELGFKNISDNSMDGVGARDFVLEALHSIASIGITVSRYAEDLIVWSTREFGYIELDDAWSTGSSMMPQKKNPDSLELIRGKAGRLMGNYSGFAATLKGIGLTYFKDLQEDKEPFIDSADQISLILDVLSHVLATLEVKGDAIEKGLDPFLLATDLADYLVRKGLPFRKSHHVIGALVGWCISESVPLNMVPLDRMREFSPLFSEDVLSLFKWETALKGRDIPGGTGPSSVSKQLSKAVEIISKSQF